MSLASRRRLMVKSIKEEEPEIDWSKSVMPETKNTLSFPYDGDYVYALRTNADLVRSNYPIYVWKVTYRDWAYIGASDLRGNSTNITGSRWFDHDVDTSDLGDNYTKIRPNTKDYSNYVSCNHPIYQVIYDSDANKFNVVR